MYYHQRHVKTQQHPRFRETDNRQLPWKFHGGDWEQNLFFSDWLTVRPVASLCSRLWTGSREVELTSHRLDKATYLIDSVLNHTKQRPSDQMWISTPDPDLIKAAKQQGLPIRRLWTARNAVRFHQLDKATHSSQQGARGALSVLNHTKQNQTDWLWSRADQGNTAIRQQSNWTEGICFGGSGHNSQTRWLFWTPCLFWVAVIVRKGTS